MSLFKAYDLRGSVPDEINEDIAYRVGRAFVHRYHCRSLAVGFDIRNESPSICSALIRGLTDAGANVTNIGMCGTEEVYFAVFHRKLDGGIMVTASHNPKGHNGMKLVGPEARPISSDNGLLEIRDLVEKNEFSNPPSTGRVQIDENKSSYINHLLGYLDIQQLRPLKIVANPGNGGAGDIVRRLEQHLPLDIIYINEKPDGDFPNGVPNPLLPENQTATSEAVVANQADFGIAWDGDFDRCFFFDAHGRFIEGYYLVGLMADTLLSANPGARIVHDPRLTWNTIEQVQTAGGETVISKCGHAFIKQVMRDQDAIYGGEMSAHHYFKEFSYCDSGMIPWLLIAHLISRIGTPLAELVDQRIAAFPCSGEINFKVENSSASIHRIEAHFNAEAILIDRLDGLSMEFSNWRFNLRASNTEPLLRLNVESRGNAQLMQNKLSELVELIRG